MSLGFTTTSGCLGGAIVIFGLGVAGFFSLALFGSMVGENSESIIVYLTLLAFVAFGLAFVVFGAVQWRKSGRLRNYVNLVRFQGHWSLDKIASLSGGQDVDLALREIQALVATGPLYGYRVDPAQRTVTPYDPENPPGPVKPRLVQFACQSCGAKNRYETVEATAKCEFCGTPLVD